MTAFWLLNPGGARYAVEAQDGLEVGAAPPLFRPPLSDPILAGLAPVGDRTLVVADLGACLGLPPAAPSAPRLLLRPAGETAAVGFLLRGEARRIETDGDVLPLPEGLRQGSLAGCLLVDGLPVPLIDLRRLQEEFAGEGPPQAGEFSPALPGQQGPGGKNWRIVGTAGQSFALPKSLFPDPPRPRPTLSSLGRAPAPLAGLFAADGMVLSAWSLGTLLGESAAAEEGLLVGGARGLKVGLLVEGGRAETVAISPLSLPPWGRRSGIEKALIRDGEIVPCLRLRGLTGKNSEAGSWPGEGCPAPARLPDGPWEVVEFRLGGSVQAVPKTDLVDVIPLSPWRRIPGLPAVVEGVTCWRDELWPVINLSSYFGPLAAAGIGCMLALQRGEHRLLLPVERFAGERRVAPGEQRLLPVELPHPLVAGCYIDQGGVGLVLDVPALVHYFEPSVVQSFRAIVAGEREEGTDRSVPEPVTAPLVPAAPREEERTPIVPAEEKPGREERPHFPAAGESVGPFPAEFAEEFSGEPAAESLPVIPVEERADDPIALFAEEIGAEEIGEEPAEESPETEGKAEERRDGPVEAPVPALSGQEREGSLPGAAGGVALARGGEELTPGEECRRDRLEEEEIRPPAEEIARGAAPQETAILAGAFADLPSRGEGEAEFSPAAPEAPVKEAAPLPPSVQAPVLIEKPLPLSAPPAPPLPLRPVAGDRRRPGWRTAAAVSLLAAASLAGWLLSREPEPRGGQAALSAAKASLSPAAAAPAAPAVPRPSEERAEAVFRPEEVRPPAPVGEEAAPYTVTPGDTLWDISERFLRNPYRYDDLARANRIPNPHRIYPGQVIRIEREPSAEAIR